eukprot:TRINITY_DN105228_c0_g1_i1.p1 TRINITY_DN105228_c0_g1~~TRINITY_DN105228_c0_g1_i1.p1  ORF type:complete len:383 (+),score=31.80 TRINITY_DN105228_c0_g1_i1:64-1149(+)
MAASSEKSSIRETLQLTSTSASLTIDLAGGAFAAFQLKDGIGSGVNPLSWDSAVHDGEDASSLAPRPLGHFLCCDRWGPASESEEANGMPYHGEASYVTWKALDSAAGTQQAALEAALPMGGLKIKREVKLLGSSAVAVVSDVVTNVGKLGRVYNMVQHPSIAAPFLDERTLVDCNGKRGFTQGEQRTYLESPADPTYQFPTAITPSGKEVTARGMTGGEDDVSSYEVEPGSPFGWICATSPGQKLVLGYIWPSQQYPWISLWCSSGDGVPRARGLEFGTTGLHQPFPILARHPRLLDLPTFDFLDAGESKRRSFAFFLVEVPADFEGVKTVEMANGELRLTEQGAGRQVVLPISEPLFEP